MTSTRTYLAATPIRGALFCMALVLAGLSGCVAKPTGYSDFDIETDFSGFKSFAFPPNKALIVSSPDPVNPALESVLKEEVQRYLTRKGFTFSPKVEDADFVIGFAVGSTPTARTTIFTSNYRQVYIIGDTRPAQVVTQQGMDGGLVIDLYERDSGQKKWMGWAIQEITMSDQVRLQGTVRELVGIILQHFPPQI